MKHNPQGITTAMQLYFSGESLRNTAKSIRLIGIERNSPDCLQLDWKIHRLDGKILGANYA